MPENLNSICSAARKTKHVKFWTRSEKIKRSIEISAEERAVRHSPAGDRRDDFVSGVRRNNADAAIENDGDAPLAEIVKLLTDSAELQTCQRALFENL